MFLNKRKFSALAWVVLSTLALSACNGTDDFSDASLTSPVLGGDGDPANPDGPAVEIEFVSGLDAASPRAAVISNLGYTCGGTTAYIAVEGNIDGFIANRARCPLTAEQITFFIGDTGNIDRRIEIGTALIPVVSGRSGENTGFYQISIADLQDAPARSAATDKAVSFRAALLAALDSDPASVHVIEVPDAAHDVVANQLEAAPDPLFDTAGTYAEFTADWQDWLDAVTAEAGLVPSLAFPANEADAQAMAAAGSERVRSGVWILDHNASVSYILTFPEDDNYKKMTMQMNALVMPDGLVRGIGQVLYVSDPEAQVDPALDAITFTNADESVGDLLFLGGGAGEVLEIEGILDGEVALEASGRLIGSAGYDAIPVDDPDSDGVRIDYELDYPSREADADLVPEEATRIGGLLYGEVLPSLAMRAGRSGVFGPSIDPAVFSQLPQFYQLQFLVACVEGEVGDCVSIPEDELGVNYATNVAGFTVEDEKPREWQAGDEGLVNLEILPSGYIVTDRDRDCASVDGSLNDGDIQEYRVGFVSRTLADGESANIILMLSGPAAWSEPTDTANQLPQFGSTVSGRILLTEPDMPIYRLSDNNFEARLRAAWVDVFQPIKLTRENPEPDDVTAQTISASNKGALGGVALDSGTCTPIPPAP